MSKTRQEKELERDSLPSCYTDGSIDKQIDRILDYYELNIDRNSGIMDKLKGIELIISAFMNECRSFEATIENYKSFLLEEYDLSWRLRNEILDSRAENRAPDLCNVFDWG